MNRLFSFGEFNSFPDIITQKLSDVNNPPPLEELLIEEGIIEQLQNKNDKLIKYLNKEKIKQMLDYIIKEPKEEDHNKGHKFPFVCSKLFNVEEIKVMKYFFKTNKELENEKDGENDDNIKENKNVDYYFDLNQDDKINIEERYNNFEDKEINTDVNQIDINEENNKNKNEDKENINNDKINIENNISSNNNNNDKEENEHVVNQDNNEKNDNKEKDNKEINNLIENQGYQIVPIKKENNENNKDKNNNLDIDDKYPEDKIEILDYFFSFLLDDSELNYVLCSYFSSLMINLLNINSTKIIKYLFLKRKDILKRLVFHSYRKCIAETLCKIIKYEDKYNEENNESKNDNNIKEFSKIRAEIIKDLFDKIDINMNTEKLYSISFIINDLIDNKKIFDFIINNKSIIHSLIIKQLKDIKIIKKENENNEEILINKKNNFIIIIDIIINWLNNIKNNDIIPMLLYEVNDDINEENDFVQQKENDNLVPEVHHTILSQALFDILPNLITNNFNKNNDYNNNDFAIQSYNDYKLKPLGLYKVKIIEILISLMSYCKNIPNEYDNLLINSNFYENALNYIFEYEWNNLYQESLFQLLKKLFTYDKDFPYHEVSADYLLSKINILNIIITNLTNNKDKHKNDSNSGIGYMAFLVRLSYKINTIIGGNYLNLNKSYTREGSITFINKGENLNNNTMDIYKFDLDKKMNEENNKNKIEIKPVDFMKKYCNEEWNNFFRDNISNKIKIYEEKLCQPNNNTNGDDLFDNTYDNDINNGNNEEEDLLGGYKSRDEELYGDNNNNKEEEVENLLGGYKSRDEDLFGDNNNNINNNDEKINLVNNDVGDSYKINKNSKNLINTDMEININDFQFVDDEIKNDKHDNENNNNEENKDQEIINKNKEIDDIIDNIYNSVNYWKKSLEKENNSYLNNIGKEALNDLLE